MSFKAIILTIIIQLIVVGLFLLGMLLDPLAGLVIAALYFVIPGTFFLYKYVKSKIQKK